jgi:elongation factor G
MTAQVWDAGEMVPRATAIPAELLECARARRRRRLEQVVELEDEATALYLKDDSSPMAFELATREAFKIACAKAGPVLLEPVMRVVVTTPKDYLGPVIGDLQSRRGSVLASDMKAGAREIVAHVPLANMFSYVNALCSLSQGRASFTMQLDRYARMPKALQAKVLDKAY